MSSLIEHADRVDAARSAEVARLNAILNEEPKCQSIYHDGGEFAHGGPAAYWQIGTCIHGTGLRCATIVHSYIPGLPFRCEVCGVRSPFDAYRWIEL